MKDAPSRTSLPHRRTFLQSIFAAGALPWVVPASALGREGTTAPSNKITLGVLGVGSQGQWDMRAFLNHPDVQVTAICDVNKRNIESARRVIGEAYGKSEAKVFTDFRELNGDASLDAIQMTLPVHWHAIPSLDAIRHGKHIYHEKPMGMSLEEAKRVRDAVRNKGVVFQFGTQQRSDQYFRWACELALSGRLGKVRQIQVSVPGGRQGPLLPEEPLPDYVDWDRWVGPAPMTPFNAQKLARDWHENITNFSLGMISCWGIHHLDIAQWGNGTDATGPTAVEGTGEFPQEGTCDAILRWKVRFEHADAAGVLFVSDGEGLDHGVRFVGDKRWVHVARGSIRAHDDKFLRDPENKPNKLAVKLPVSRDHTRNFVDAIKSGKRPICDVETAVRSDTLCQIALIAVKLGRRLRWDPQTEHFGEDAAANEMLRSRPMRGPWRLA
jgi:predicted dehydrogenase